MGEPVQNPSFASSSCHHSQTFDFPWGGTPLQLTTGVNTCTQDYFVGVSIDLISLFAGGAAKKALSAGGAAAGKHVKLGSATPATTPSFPQSIGSAIVAGLLPLAAAHLARGIAHLIGAKVAEALP